MAIKKKKLSLVTRKWLVCVHVVFISTFIGTVIVNLLLSYTATRANDIATLKSAYTSLIMIADLKIIYVVAIGSLISGMVLSVSTQWGLFKYYWILLKEALFIGLIFIQMLGNRIWIKEAAQTVTSEGFRALQDPLVSADSQKLLLGFGLQIIALTAMLIVSIFKPWGRRRELLRSSDK